MNGHARSKALVLALGLLSVAAGAHAADVYKASAKFTNAQGERVSAPVTISIDGQTTETERLALRDMAKADPKAAGGLLSGLKDLGYIEAVDRKVPIRFASVQPGGDGQIITVISDEPLGFIGSNKKYVKSKEGYELTYAMIAVDGAGKGRGEMAPACKIKFMESGAPAVDDYGSQVVWLDDVEKLPQP
jgi:hypothetical protein